MVSRQDDNIFGCAKRMVEKIQKSKYYKLNGEFPPPVQAEIERMKSHCIKKMTAQQRQEFESVTRPVIEWLNANCHPHVTVVIDPTSAELSEGTIAYTTTDYLR